MIKVTVELVSAINPRRSRVLGVAIIANDGVRSFANPSRGSYDVTLSRSGKQAYFIWKRGRVVDFPRKRLLAWDLLYCALRNIVGGRNPLIKLKNESANRFT